MEDNYYYYNISSLSQNKNHSNCSNHSNHHLQEKRCLVSCLKKPIAVNLVMIFLAHNDRKPAFKFRKPTNRICIPQYYSRRSESIFILLRDLMTQGVLWRGKFVFRANIVLMKSVDGLGNTNSIEPIRPLHCILPIRTTHWFMSFWYYFS